MSSIYVLSFQLQYLLGKGNHIRGRDWIIEDSLPETEAPTTTTTQVLETDDDGKLVTKKMTTIGAMVLFDQG